MTIARAVCVYSTCFTIACTSGAANVRTDAHGIDAALEPPREEAREKEGGGAVDAGAPRNEAAIDAGARVDFAALVKHLFPLSSEAAIPGECPPTLIDDARVSCLFSRRFPHDDAAAKIATELFTEFGIASGVNAEETIDGGFRGTLHLVPAVPEGADRKHIEWILASYKEFRAFFDALAERAHKRAPYRWDRVSFRFMKSVNGHRPSAWALDWTIAYNLKGSLLLSQTAVMETLFHETFHLNDEEHGDWSPGALSEIFDPIVKKCGTAMACLAPYAPNDTTVRGGTYYAFQPQNGRVVHEYAAELAVRYFKEHRAIIRGEPEKTRFKCINGEDKRAWEKMRDEFFGGIDLTRACG